MKIEMTINVCVNALLLQVLKVILVLWVNLAGLDLLVSLEPTVTQDPLVSLEPLENKVCMSVKDEVIVQLFDPEETFDLEERALTLSPL